jgi:fructoselysine-6-P-deglycase FrlB-like protein
VTTGSPDRVAQFATDIAGSTEVLARFVHGWQSVELGGRSRFALSGLGSSRYAALVVAGSLRAAGSSAWVEYASTSTPSVPADDLVLVGISASGRTREVLDAARRHKGRSLVVGVTNDPDSALAEMADLVVPLLAGEETAGIACRTYRATIAAVALLTGALAGPDELRPIVDGLTAAVIDHGPWLERSADVLDGAASIDVLADASLLGLAEQAALMLREAPRLPARAYDTGDWLHTGVYLAFPGHRALLFPGAAADDEVSETVRRRGGEVLIVPRSGDAVPDPIGRAIVDSIVAERLAVELWGRATAG